MNTNIHLFVGPA